MQPKYIQIMEYIQRDIDNGVYRPGEKLPTEKALMEKYQVSRIVVVNALNILKNKGVIYRAQGRGSFVSYPNDERQQEMQRRNCIAVVIPDIKTGYSIHLSSHIAEYVRHRGFYCAFFFTFNKLAEEERILKMLMDEYVEGRTYSGVLLLSCAQGTITETTYYGMLLQMMNLGVPLVLVDRNIQDLSAFCVQTDNYLAVKEATRYLIQKGHQKIILCLSSTGMISSLHERINGFQAEMAAHKLETDTSEIIDHLDMPFPRDLLKKLLLDHHVTALIGVNSNSTKEVFQLVSECGLRIPEDVSLISIDEFINDFQGKSFTKILQNTDGIASYSVDLLFSIITGTIKETPRTVLIPPILVEGDTVWEAEKTNEAFQNE